MAAGMGSRDSVLALTEIAREGDILEAVNFNSPMQTVVAGDIVAVERFAELAKNDRSLGVKAIPLPVSGAFHSPIMRPAAEGLAEALKDYYFGTPKYKMLLNSTGRSLEDFAMDNEYFSDSDRFADKFDNKDISEVIRAVMVRQIQNPVEWQKTIEAIKESGINTIIEVGPGKTLSGLAKKIVPELITSNVEDAESLYETVSLMKEEQ
jgi:[acyl-carrier-protein] S-malonyltransferase